MGEVQAPHLWTCDNLLVLLQPVHTCSVHVNMMSMARRLLLWEDTADQAVSQEDVGGLLRRPGADSDLILVPGRIHVALQVDDLPPHGERPPRSLSAIPFTSSI